MLGRAIEAVTGQDYERHVQQRVLRRHDVRNGVVLCNASIGADGISLVRAVDPPVHAAAKEVESWPEYDLFEDEYDADHRPPP